MPKLLGKTSAPTWDSVVNPRKGSRLTTSWERWFDRLAETVGTIPGILNSVTLDEQSAAITATAFSGGVLAKGVYRVSYHARISQAATTSSSLTVTIAWEEDGVSQSVAGAAMTGNTTTTRQSDVFLVRSDASEDVTYAAAYASAGATSMEYSLDLSFEQIRL